VARTWPFAGLFARRNHGFRGISTEPPCGLRFLGKSLIPDELNRTPGLNSAYRPLTVIISEVKIGWKKLAGATGLEPAASCVTGRRSPSRGDTVSCRLPLASFHRFRLRARLGPPWPTEVSPLTDPTVQISRSGFLKQYSPFSKSA